MEDEALDKLRARGLPAALLDVWAGHVAEQLPAFWARPHTYFKGREALWELAPGLAGLIPIVEQNGEAIIGVLPHEDRYVQCYYEDLRHGDDAIKELGRGYQQFAMTILLRVAEYVPAEEEAEFAEAARLLEFDHGDELWALCLAGDDAGIEALFARLGPGPRGGQGG